MSGKNSKLFTLLCHVDSKMVMSHDDMKCVIRRQLKVAGDFDVGSLLKVLEVKQIFEIFASRKKTLFSGVMD